MGVRGVETGDGVATLEMAKSPWLCNAFGVIYGGTIAYLADAERRRCVRRVVVIYGFPSADSGMRGPTLQRPDSASLCVRVHSPTHVLLGDPRYRTGVPVSVHQDGQHMKRAGRSRLPTAS